jgi:EAL domain-containing protein (putative c-di-GMP-specific phosphodiesterase class I)
VIDQSSESEGQFPSTSASILVVDDDLTVRRTLRRVFTSAGLEVVDAVDGEEAAGLVLGRNFDVILSDIAMPALGGIDLLRVVRERDLDVPVVLLTGDPDIETAAKAVQYGAFRYLIKPINVQSLRRTVEQAIRLHRLARLKREALTYLGHSGKLVGDRAGLEGAFDRSLRTLWMAYQPIVAADERALYGYEAFLRTEEPALPGPIAVIRAAERLNRLRELGQRIRAEVARAFRHVEHGKLFVNVHARDLLDDMLASSDTPLAQMANRIVLEITDRASLDEVRDGRLRIQRLRRMGFQIAIDDLGAGYAGLNSFAYLEPDIVKLDISLVRNLETSPTKCKIVQTLLTLCRELGILVVAEGVETEEEAHVLRDMGCDFLQGYAVGRPVRLLEGAAASPPGAEQGRAAAQQ